MHIFLGDFKVHDLSQLMPSSFPPTAARHETFTLVCPFSSVPLIVSFFQHDTFRSLFLSSFSLK